MRIPRRTSGALLMAGGVLYATWLLAFVLPSDVSPWTSYASELAADGQPFAWLYRAGDLLSGGIFVVAGLLALWAHRSGAPEELDGLRVPGGLGPRRERWVLALVVVFGLATIVDALSPMACVETASAACRARVEAGHVPFSHVRHTWSSAVAGGSFWLALLVAVARRPMSLLAKLLAALVAAWSVATVWTLLTIMPGASMHLLGIAQRVELALTTACLLVMGWERLRHGAGNPAASLAGSSTGSPSSEHLA